MLPLRGNLQATIYQKKELPGEHVVTNISTEIQEMLNGWNIDIEKVVIVVTDNAKNGKCYQ